MTKNMTRKAYKRADIADKSIMFSIALALSALFIQSLLQAF